MSTGRACYALQAPSPAATARWLRKRLASVRDDKPLPKPRPLRRWLSGALSIGADELQPGLAVAVRLVSGSLWLGTVRDVSETTLLLKPWGSSQDMAVALLDVASIKVVPEHTWGERQLVIERQRRGQPALVKQKPNEQ